METEGLRREGDTDLVGDSRYPAVVIDIDGTIARHVSRHWSAYDQLHTDEPIDAIHALTLAMVDYGYAVLMLTGRPEQYHPQTRAWLVKHGFKFDKLFMRSAKDNRSNAEFKRDTYERFIQPEYRVVFAVDDNPHVVSMFRKLGVTVLDVGSSHYGSR